MKRTFKFYEFPTKKPKTSGYYLTIDVRERLWVLHWSAKHQAWDCYDHRESSGNVNSVIMYWANIK